jgi:hypothetical protein
MERTRDGIVYKRSDFEGYNAEQLHKAYLGIFKVIALTPLIESPDTSILGAEFLDVKDKRYINGANIVLHLAGGVDMPLYMSGSSAHHKIKRHKEVHPEVPLVCLMEERHPQTRPSLVLQQNVLNEVDKFLADKTSIESNGDSCS